MKVPLTVARHSNGRDRMLPLPNLETDTQDTTLRTRPRGTQLVEALRCKPEGRGVFGIFHRQSFRSGSTRHFHVPIVLKSGSLNHLEPSEPLQVCTWIGFLFFTTRPAQNVTNAEPKLRLHQCLVLENGQLLCC